MPLVLCVAERVGELVELFFGIIIFGVPLWWCVNKIIKNSKEKERVQETKAPPLDFKHNQIENDFRIMFESIKIVENTKSDDTRRSRINTALEALGRLEAWGADFKDLTPAEIRKYIMLYAVKPSPDTDAQEAEHIAQIECMQEAKVYESQLVEFVVSARDEKDIDKRIEYYQVAVETYYHFKDVFYEKGDAHVKYFRDMWEHSSSKYNKGKCYITDIEEKMNDLVKNRDHLKALQERRMVSHVDLDESISELLRQNPGMLQKEIYKHFDEVLKPVVQSNLYYGEKEGRYLRIKNGSSYEVYLP